MKSTTTTTTTNGVRVGEYGKSQHVNHSHSKTHVYLTTMTVLLMWQTQCFILTVSLPADL